MDERDKSGIIQILIIMLIIGYFFNFMAFFEPATEEECIESGDYTYLTDGKPIDKRVLFIPFGIFLLHDASFCANYAIEEAVEICNNGECYKDIRIIYRDKEMYERFSESSKTEGGD